MRNLLIVVIIFVGFCSCNKDKEVETVLRIASERGTCHLYENFPCYIVKYEHSDTWQRMTDSITGFDYEEGYEYELLVTKIEKKNPPMDWSGEYRLKSIMSKIEKKSENLPPPAPWESED